MFSNNNVLVLTSLLFQFLLCVSGTDVPIGDTSHRTRRQLLFPNSSVLQFNVGIGTPTPAKLITLNYAFQANFQLPWNRSQIPIDILEANGGYDGNSRKKRNANDYSSLKERDSNYESDARLYHFYKYVEEFLNSFGHNGTSCILRTLCQLGAEPLHSPNEDDLLHEIATFVLNPKNDLELAPTYSHEILPYVEAYERGISDYNCVETYDNCTIALLEMFSKIEDYS
ncbi:uncharacterized protein LOC113510842 [Galleria mellonella]|uniref:Uncharacterized protein LOC113510842 n=1 Tax=Galleria mellonella TaxID=7137 RepID=A0A6J1WAI2_GALME|nr:uncharacterized protein LOC113510842 [Galleria mellonella]